MEITGKIIVVLPAEEGVSKRTGNAWKSQNFVIETNDQYPRKCCFRVFGDEKLKQFNIQQGEIMTVSFDIDAHEYNGRWYNDIRAWQINRNVQPMAAPQPAQGVPYGQAPAQGAPYGQAPVQGAPYAPNQRVAQSNSSDDLPF